MLLEALVSLLILGIAVAALMRSFTQSLACAKIMEVQTQANFFAQQLLHEFELFPPNEGKSEGGFGNDYGNYSYYVEVRYVEPKYARLDGINEIEQFFVMREVTIEIRYDDGVHKPRAPIRLESAITGFEKYSPESKRSYLNF